MVEIKANSGRLSSITISGRLELHPRLHYVSVFHVHNCTRDRSLKSCIITHIKSVFNSTLLQNNKRNVELKGNCSLRTSKLHNLYYERLDAFETVLGALIINVDVPVIYWIHAERNFQ